MRTAAPRAGFLRSQDLLSGRPPQPGAQCELLQYHGYRITHSDHGALVRRYVSARSASLAASGERQPSTKKKSHAGAVGVPDTRHTGGDVASGSRSRPPRRRRPGRARPLHRARGLSVTSDLDPVACAPGDGGFGERWLEYYYRFLNLRIPCTRGGGRGPMSHVWALARVLSREHLIAHAEHALYTVGLKSIFDQVRTRAVPRTRQRQDPGAYAELVIAHEHNSQKATPCQTARQHHRSHNNATMICSPQLKPDKLTAQSTFLAGCVGM